MVSSAVEEDPGHTPRRKETPEQAARSLRIAQLERSRRSVTGPGGVVSVLPQDVRETLRRSGEFEKDTH